MKQKISNWVLKYLLNATVLDDIISNDPKTGVVLLNGNPLGLDELRQLQAEIKALEGFRLWKILTQTPKQKAEEKIFIKSVNMEDIRFGKAMLYNISLQENIIKIIKNKN